MEETDAEPDDVVALLVGEAVTRALQEIEADARASSDELGASEIIAWLKLRMEELRLADTRRPALDLLVPFLRAGAVEVA